VSKAVQAVFLDRDGVLNREVGLVTRPEQLVLEPGAAEAVRRLNEAGVLAVVATNQPVVARGLCSEEDLARIHERLQELLWMEARARLDAIYYCPHHPERGHPDANPLYRGPCRCRKPAVGMLEVARERFGLDLRRCVLVGDRTADLLAARRAGCRSVLVRTGYAGRDGRYEVEPDHVAANLAEAVRLILRRRGRGRAWRPLPPGPDNGDRRRTGPGDMSG